MASGTQLFVLGAGCSMTSGYPSATTMLPGLKQFGDTLGDDAVQIRGCVTRTVDLMNRLRVETIDELAHRLHHGLADDTTGAESSRERYRRMTDAKVAVSAFFESLESSAAAKGLRSYHEFLHRLFPSESGRHYQDQLVRSTGRVLSFNYDRLFEIAFCQHFKLDQGFGFYGTLGLNSGVNPFHNGNLTFEENRFSFLKLHGSVGMFAWEEYGEIRIGHRTPDANGSAQINDAAFYEPNQDKTPSARPLSTLIFFPHEKQYLLSEERTAFPYRQYAKQVWERAEVIAAGATEIWLIGYSLWEADFPYLMRLLRAPKNCDKIVIQNPNDADRIQEKLRTRARDIADKLEVYRQPF
jgi:hypothetical protein